MDRWPVLVFSSYILEGWIMLHLLMCSSFIGRMASTCLYLVILLYSSLCYRMGGLVGLCSVVLQDGWPRLACVQ